MHALWFPDKNPSCGRIRSIHNSWIARSISGQARGAGFRSGEVCMVAVSPDRLCSYGCGSSCSGWASRSRGDHRGCGGRRPWVWGCRLAASSGLVLSSSRRPPYCRTGWRGGHCHGPQPKFLANSSIRSGCQRVCTARSPSNRVRNDGPPYSSSGGRPVDVRKDSTSSSGADDGLGFSSFVVPNRRCRRHQCDSIRAGPDERDCGVP